MANPDVGRLRESARESRVRIIHMLTHAGSGHPGGSLSVIDILTVLYENRMRYDPEAAHVGRPRPARAFQGALRARAVRVHGQGRLLPRDPAPYSP